MTKALIITADDFGLSDAVNEAVEQAHLQGVLGTASLMVGASAAADAVKRALRLPLLKVGLHLVLTGSKPVLAPSEIPDLLGPDGNLSKRFIQSGFRFHFRKSVRAQLEREIRAQFELFRQFGLTLDHVNSHKHLHLHPTVFDLIVKVGAGYGLKAVRLPYEPLCPAQPRRLASWIFLLPWTGLLRKKIRRAGIYSNDRVFGLGDSGRMELNTVLRILQRFPSGVTEMYFHPAARLCPELKKEAPGYRHVEEFAALIDPAFVRAIDDLAIKRIGFADLPMIKQGLKHFRRGGF